MTLNIPDEIVAAIKWPREQLDRQLSVEMAFALYQRGLASMGSARRLAQLDKWAFIEGLAERRIARHYGEKELEEDISDGDTRSQ
jgi:predicted HTH domain antitoxin